MKQILQAIEDELISIAKALQGGNRNWCDCTCCNRWRWLGWIVDMHPAIQRMYKYEDQPHWSIDDPTWDDAWEENAATLRYRFAYWLEQKACVLT